MLENISSCPVCKSKARIIKYQTIRDTLYSTPGEWTFWECNECHSGYLSPRLSEAAIHLAYQNYHTHKSPVQVDSNQLDPLRFIRRKLSNGYKNWKYKTNYAPSSKLGIVAAYLIPEYKSILDRQFRGLNCNVGSVLDFGFGDGSFLKTATDMGWHATGVDPDPVTVSNARKAGFNVVQGGINVLDPASTKFDAITLCNVLEHLHEPRQDLKKCLDLLNPGGHIWIETPNFESVGHAIFKSCWRGLEPPRHLSIFTPDSLTSLLQELGFTDVRHLKQPNCVPGIFAASKATTPSHSDNANIFHQTAEKLIIFAASLYEILDHRKREFISIMANKPI